MTAKSVNFRKAKHPTATPVVDDLGPCSARIVCNGKEPASSRISLFGRLEVPICARCAGAVQAGLDLFARLSRGR